MTAGFTNQEDNYGKNEKTKTAGSGCAVFSAQGFLFHSRVLYMRRRKTVRQQQKQRLHQFPTQSIIKKVRIQTLLQAGLKDQK